MKRVPILYKTWLHVLLILIITSGAYYLTALIAGNTHKHDDVYFDFLAGAFLRGELHIYAPVHYDLTQFGGRWYVPFLPMPSFLMLPFVTAFGVLRGVEVPFSSFVGGINVAVMYLILQTLARRGWTQLGGRSNLWLTALLAFGSVHWYMATDGQVWFLSQIVSVTILALTILVAVQQKHPLIVGIFFGMLLWTRPHLALAAPFILFALFQNNVRFSLRNVRAWLAFGAPIALSAVLLLWYNAARFHNPLDFGYLTEDVSKKLLGDLKQYGQFNLYFLGRNMQWAFLTLPQWQWKFPFLLPDKMGEGMSVFATTPALLYLFRRLPRATWTQTAWVSLLLLQIPLLLYYNTGWVQFGYRFGLDYLVIAICILAYNAGQKVSPRLAFLIALSMLVNLRGVHWWYTEHPK